MTAPISSQAATQVSLSPLPTEPEEEVCLVGDSDGGGFAIGIVSTQVNHYNGLF